jgi:hypothetical protein
MMNQLKMIKHKAGDNEVEESAWVPDEVSFWLPRNFGQPKAAQNWGQPLTNKILWSALSYHELGSPLVNRRSLVSLCASVQRQAFS